MKKTHIKLMIAVNIVLLLVYAFWNYADGGFIGGFIFGLYGFGGVGIAGSIVNIIALFVMLFCGTSVKKNTEVLAVLLVICIVLFVLCIVANSLAFLLPMAGIWILLYSMLSLFVMYGVTLDVNE